MLSIDSTAIVHLASDPPRPPVPPRSATPPGECGRAPWHASGRLGRRAPSAAAQERVANPGSRAHGPGSSSSAPPGSSQHHRAHAVVVGKARGLPEGHGRPSGCPLAASGPALPSHLPRVCPSGLLAAAAGCGCCCCCCWRPPRPAGGNLWPSRTIFAVSHPLVTPGWGRGHSLGQSGRSWVHGHHPPPPPHLPLPPQPSPHPRFGPAVTQPLSGSHPM